MIYAGIDYSLTSPAITVYDDSKPFTWDNCYSYFLSDIKKTHGVHENVVGTPLPLYNSSQERYSVLARWVMDILHSHCVDHVFIEDYSYGSTGRVFHIAENTGVLKQVLWSCGYKFDVIAPTVIKKHATGKGNASKTLMIETFHQETITDLRAALNLTEKQSNPISDIIDSYYIVKTGYIEWIESI